MKKKIAILTERSKSGSDPIIKDSRTIPKTSSITAPPRMLAPILLSSICISINDRTVIPTDVAISINPRTRLSFNEYPLNIVNENPNRNGMTIPPIAMKKEGLPILFSCLIFVDNPEINIRKRIPISAKRSNSAERQSRCGTVIDQSIKVIT